MLKSVARHFIDRDIHNYCFVFPNRRAGLFFHRYLTQEAHDIKILPEITTIADFFQSYTKSKVADNLTLLFELYTIYTAVLSENSRPDESFSSFISFGQTLLKDFNDIDNYLVDAEKLFQNIDDLQQLSSDSHLTESQREAIAHFFNYKTRESDHNKHIESFKSIWSLLYSIYSRFRESLRNMGLAYSGMLCRDVIEAGKGSLETHYERVVFVGFNALDEVERALFRSLGQKADFYWDYSIPAITDDKKNLAGRFVKDNTDRFPSKEEFKAPEIPTSTTYTHIITSSMTSQAQEASKILRHLQANNINTAIVLLDEKMLLPMLMALPMKDRDRYKINVTMGFPISHTTIIKFIEDFILLQNSIKTTDSGFDFYHKFVNSILNHPYILSNAGQSADIIKSEMVKNNIIRLPESLFENTESELIREIFKHYADSELPDAIINIISLLKAENEYDAECISQVLLAINRLKNLIKQYHLPLDKLTLLHIIDQAISGIKVSFEGEPLEGLQIMGTLETRCLNFENIILLSFNEGIFPSTSNIDSYIPYNLRKGFNIPTTEHQDAVYAYNFYRLTARAKNVYMISDCRTDNMKNGEPSRYLSQLKYIYGKDIKTIIASNNITINKGVDAIEKPADWLERFSDKDKDKKITLSASSINTFMSCGIKFYIQKYLNILEPKEVTDIMEANQFGSVFHKAMQTLYTKLRNELHDGEFTKDALTDLYNNQLTIEKAVTDAFRSEYFNNSQHFTITGINRIMFDLIVNYIKATIQTDIEKVPFKLVECEKYCKAEYFIKENQMAVEIKGFIDRVDSFKSSDGSSTLRLLDYKTGSVHIDLKKGMEHKNNETARQLMLYKYLIQNAKQDSDNKSVIKLDVYQLTKLSQGQRETNVAYEDRYGDFLDVLDSTIKNILDPNQTLQKSKNAIECKYCKFTEICKTLTQKNTDLKD